MNGLRGVTAALMVVVALLLQVSVFHYFAWDGVVPDLVLLVVVAGALVRGGQFGMVLGFCAGLLLDLVPPADHTAGRWAIALLLVGYVAGLVRADAGGTSSRGTRGRPPAMTVMATVGGCSFVGTSVFALSGLLLHDDATGTGSMLGAVGISLVWDLLLTPLVLPGAMALLRRLEPERARV